MQTGTEVLSVLDKIKLDRNSDVALYEQVRASIAVAIMLGEIDDGAQLPSIRRLANALDVSPVTIVQAYRDLQDQQFIKSVPKRGYFVSIGTDEDASAQALELTRRLVDQAIDAGLQAGMSDQAFLGLVAERVKHRARSPLKIAVVGKKDSALSERVRAVSQNLWDLNVHVIGISFESLENADQDFFESLGEVVFFVVPVGEMTRASSLLGTHAQRIVPMINALPAEVHDFIVRQPAGTRFGIIGDSSDQANRIISVLRRIHPLQAAPVQSNADDVSGIRRVIADSDVLILGALARPRVSSLIPDEVPTLDFNYLPDHRTLVMVRSRVLELEGQPDT